MFWNRTLLAVTVGMVFLPATSLALDVDVYGRLNVTLDDSDFGGEDEKTTGLTNRSSRLGVKGSHELSSSVEAFYQAEFGVNFVKDGDVFSNRNQFIGLRGDFGSATVGRRDTAMKLSQGKVDQFSSHEGDLKTLFEGDNRVSQQISYATPKFGPAALQLETTYVTERAKGQDSDDDGKGDNGISMAVKIGDSGYKKLPYYAAVAYDSKVQGFDVLRVTVGGRIADLELGAMYNEQEQTGTSESRDGYLVSAAYIIGDTKLKAQYQDGDGVDDQTKGSIYSLGVEHRLSKQLRAVVYYTGTDFDNGVDFGSSAAVGLRYDF